MSKSEQGQSGGASSRPSVSVTFKQVDKVSQFPVFDVGVAGYSIGEVVYRGDGAGFNGWYLVLDEYMVNVTGQEQYDAGLSSGKDFGEFRSKLESDLPDFLMGRLLLEVEEDMARREPLGFRLHFWRVSTTNRPVFALLIGAKEEEIGQVTYIEGQGWYLKLWDVWEGRLREEGFIGGESFLDYQGRLERELMGFLERHGVVEVSDG